MNLSKHQNSFCFHYLKIESIDKCCFKSLRKDLSLRKFHDLEVWAINANTAWHVIRESDNFDIFGK